MSELRADFWVDALIRRAESGFASVYVIHRGDETAGAVLVKVVAEPGQARLFVPARDEAGERIWQMRWASERPEGEVDGYCRKRLETDPDLWWIEIEDRQGRHFLTEAVVDH